MKKFGDLVGTIIAVLILLLLVGVAGCLVGLVTRGLMAIWGPVFGGGF